MMSYGYEELFELMVGKAMSEGASLQEAIRIVRESFDEDELVYVNAGRSFDQWSKSKSH